MEQKPASESIRAQHAAALQRLPFDASSPGIETDGDASVLQRVLAVVDPGDDSFAIVTP
jgi:alkyl sulfatase BDS1-like metallo-beta-lactamase superfamily hydrolase